MAFNYAAQSSVTVANSTTQTSLLPATITLAANEIQPGFTMRLKVGGIMSTTGAPTLRVAVYVGAVIVGDASIVTLPTIASAQFDLEFLLTFSSNGASATYQSGGRFLIVPGGGTAATTVGFPIAESVSTANLTNSNTVDVKVTWGTANASNSIRSDVVVIESTTI